MFNSNHIFFGNFYLSNYFLFKWKPRRRQNFFKYFVWKNKFFFYRWLKFRFVIKHLKNKKNRAVVSFVIHKKQKKRAPVVALLKKYKKKLKLHTFKFYKKQKRFMYIKNKKEKYVMHKKRKKIKFFLKSVLFNNTINKNQYKNFSRSGCFFKEIFLKNLSIKKKHFFKQKNKMNNIAYNFFFYH